MPDELLRQLAGQGTGWLLFVLALLAILWLTREQKQATAQFAMALKEQYDKRIEEMGKSAAALERANTTVSLMTEASNDQTESLKLVAAMIAGAIKDREAQEKLWVEKFSNQATILENNRKALLETLDRNYQAILELARKVNA